MNKISAATITRTALLGLALTNQTLTVMGKSPLPIADEDMTVLVSIGLTVCASVLAWWKNNSFTKKAIAADTYLNGGK